jgi:hypothetical protein
MGNALQLSAETQERIALGGDVSVLKPAEKVNYYMALCQRVGLDAATQPFKLMKLNGREVFYLGREGAQQLNFKHGISHQIISREKLDGVYVVTARASIGNRFTESVGAVSIGGLSGDNLANATMKAETKAKRRATLDLVGLGMLDEAELETIPAAQRIVEVKKTTPQLSAPVTTPAETPDNARRERAIKLLEEKIGETSVVLQYLQERGQIPADKVLCDWPMDKVPKTKAQMDAMLEDVAKWQEEAK